MPRLVLQDPSNSVLAQDSHGNSISKKAALGPVELEPDHRVSALPLLLRDIARPAAPRRTTSIHPFLGKARVSDCQPRWHIRIPLLAGAASRATDNLTQ